MGTSFLQANIANPRGHFEDKTIVNCHESLLSSAGSSWLYTKGDALPDSKETYQEFSKYVNARNSFEPGHWGFKDPRAILFLDVWNQLLGNQGRYFFVVRHWSACIESLLRRHSRMVVTENLKDDKLDYHLSFWTRPSLAAEMWLEYNSRLLKFVKDRPNSSMVCTQRSLFDSEDKIIELFDQRWGMTLKRQSDHSTFEQELLSDFAYSSVRDNLSHSLISQLDTLWQELLKVADLKCADENPTWTAQTEASTAFLSKIKSLDQIRSLEENLLINDKNESVLPSNESLFEVLKYNTDEDSFIKVVSDIKPASSTSNYPIGEINRIIQLANTLHPLSTKVHANVGHFLFKQRYIEPAIDSYNHAIALGARWPSVYIFLGDSYSSIGKQELAEFFYKSAIEVNNKNPQAYMRLGNLYRNKNLHDLALTHYQKAYDLASNNINILCSYCEELAYNNQTGKAIDTINNSGDLVHSDKVKSLLNSLHFQHLSLKDSSTLFFKNIKEDIKDSKLRDLKHSLSRITTKDAESDFLTRFYWHLCSVMTDAEIMELTYKA